MRTGKMESDAGKVSFHDTYEEARRAAAYDELELGNTSDLVFRNLPALLAEHVPGSTHRTSAAGPDARPAS